MTRQDRIRNSTTEGPIKNRVNLAEWGTISIQIRAMETGCEG